MADAKTIRAVSGEIVKVGERYGLTYEDMLTALVCTQASVIRTCAKGNQVLIQDQVNRAIQHLKVGTHTA